MSEDTAASWDDRYRTQEAVPERGPAPFLVENIGLLPRRGHVLDAAMGAGRNALFLAEKGYTVTGIDISPVAVERCRTEARLRRGVSIEAVCADLESYPLPGGAFDIVLVFYYLQRDLCPRLAAALRPAGILVFETFTTAQRACGWGPTRDDHLLLPGELRTLFPGTDELLYREGTVPSERGPKAVASLVARIGSQGAS
ncbi:MAG: class I SAM-dependent methyltransferase [Dehalococcoidia bacterium]|nr:class I SAM-dependent methyltransferase [Dehalococcoidia bacterium]